MKKVCFVTDSIFSIGGVQRVTAVIAKGLSKSYEVTIATFDKQNSMNTTLYELEEASIAYEFLSYPEVGRLKRFFCKCYSGLYRKLLPRTLFTSDLYAHSSFPSEQREYLQKMVGGGKYDVVVGVHAPLAVRLATLKGCQRRVGWIHNSFEALFGRDSLYIGQDLEHHYVCQMQKLDSTIVLCKHDRETYAQRFCFHPNVIYNPLTLKPYAHSLKENKKFLAVGRFSHLHKGFDLLIEAFHSYRKAGGDWTLDIVGEGPEEPLYRQMIADFQLEGVVRLHPFTNEVQKYYAEAQVYVLSSRWEGFGLVLVEAMSHGLTVVSSNLPTSVEIMGDFGIYFKTGDAEDLATKLLFATKTNLVERKAVAKSIADRFSPTAILKEWVKVLEG